MEIEIIWTKRAENELDKTLDYLKKEWTKKEILRLEQNIKEFIERIQLQPDIYPTTTKYKRLHKGMVDENNYIVYRIYPRKKQIIIVNFRDAKQKPIY
ncbi:MAG: type II toxin-antitoxin system RelE/ParE family toxin [Weeksellaceae bacterium]